jgi:cytoskeleton protein RodZ
VTPPPVTTMPTGTPPGQPAQQAALAPGTLPAATPAVPPATEAPLPPGQVYGKNNAGVRVVLRVHQPARVLVQGEDGMVYINRTLQPGDTYQVPNVVGLTLTTTNAKAVEVDLDGQAMGYAGKDTGMAEALSLDPQSIVDRQNGG